MTKWKFFVGSSILVTGLLLKAGVPLVPVAIGIVVAAFLTWRRQRSTVPGMNKNSRV